LEGFLRGPVAFQRTAPGPARRALTAPDNAGAYLPLHDKRAALCYRADRQAGAAMGNRAQGHDA